MDWIKILKKEIGVSIILGLIMLFAVAAFAARVPTVNADNNQWGTVLNEYLQVAHDSGGNIKTSSITSAMILDATIATADLASSSVNATHIVDATIGAIDIANDVVNATHLTQVSRLIFGACNVDLPQLSSAAGGVNSTLSTGNPNSANCTVSGASAGDRAIVIPQALLPANISLSNANITVGSNLTLGFTYAQNANVTFSIDPGIFSFSYIVFVNSTG